MRLTRRSKLVARQQARAEPQQWRRELVSSVCVLPDSCRIVVFGPKPLSGRGLPSTPPLNLPSGFATITCAAVSARDAVRWLNGPSAISDRPWDISHDPWRTDMRTRMTIVGALSSTVAFVIAGAVTPGGRPAAPAKSAAKRGSGAQNALGRSGPIGNLVDRRSARRSDTAAGPVRRAVGVVRRGIRRTGRRQRPDENA